MLENFARTYMRGRTRRVSCVTVHSYGFIAKISFLFSILSLVEKAINLLCKEVASECPNEYIALQTVAFVFSRVNPTQRKVVQSSREIAASYIAQLHRDKETPTTSFVGELLTVTDTKQCLLSGDFK